MVYSRLVGAKSLSPADIELLFVILNNSIALHHNKKFFYGNQVIETSNYIILVFSVSNLSF